MQIFSEDVYTQNSKVGEAETICRKCKVNFISLVFVFHHKIFVFIDAINSSVSDWAEIGIKAQMKIKNKNYW